MVKGSRQKFKHRFRKSIIPSAFKNNYTLADQQKNDSTSQVSTLLDKLRREARINCGSASTNLSPTLPQPVELLIKDRKEKKRAWDGSTLSVCKIQTLLEICSKAVAINIKSYVSYPYFPNMPTHLKQCILSSLSVYNPLTEEILPLFNTDSEYEELDLANSSINLESLKKSFWKIVKEKDLVVKNWEDLADQDEDADIISSRIFNKLIGITNEEISFEDSGTIMNKYISKLPKLRKLNLGFTHNIPGIPLSFLLVSTLPLLTHLSIAGCFNQEDGPHSLRILSGLINLLVLDVSYCEWVTGQTLLQFVNWDRDLKSLRVLAAVNCGSWNDPEIVRRKLSENRRLFELWTEWCQ